MILLFCSAAYGADYVENEVIVLTRDSNMTGSALSAAAALLCAVYPDKSANEIKMMLMNGAENVLREGYSKYGLLNACNASRTRSGDSGGGCSAGFALLALIALVPLAAWKRKK